MPSREACWIVGGLLAAVSLASGIGQWLRWRQPQSSTIANLNARIRAWWVLIAVGGGALLAGPVALLVMFACISMVALHEMLSGTVPRVERWLCLFVAVPVQYLLIWLGRFDLFALWIPVCCLLALVTRGALKRGLMLCVFCLSHIPALLLVAIPGYEGRAPLLMAFLVTIAQSSDVLQYVWGKLIGRHFLMPAISPSKTVEGLVGGVLSATALGMLLAPITPFTRWQAAGMALLVAVSGFLGGVLMSAMKRQRGLKDWGRLIAGHGGMLDRVDSLCVSAPVFFYATWWLFRY